MTPKQKSFAKTTKQKPGQRSIDSTATHRMRNHSTASQRVEHMVPPVPPRPEKKASAAPTHSKHRTRYHVPHEYPSEYSSSKAHNRTTNPVHNDQGAFEWAGGVYPFSCMDVAFRPWTLSPSQSWRYKKPRGGGIYSLYFLPIAPKHWRATNNTTRSYLHKSSNILSIARLPHRRTGTTKL